MMKLSVNEIFYSIQGEGANSGMPAIFIRLTGCNLKCPFCDTDFSKGVWMTVDQILHEISKYPCNTIIWTGGEPTLQLTSAILDRFQDYTNCIETNGTNPIPSGIDYITCSPKVSVSALERNFAGKVIGEFRYLFPGEVPMENDMDRLYDMSNDLFISPILGCGKDEENIKGAVEYVKTHPGWKLSVQIHKLCHFQ